MLLSLITKTGSIFFTAVNVAQMNCAFNFFCRETVIQTPLETSMTEYLMCARFHMKCDTLMCGSSGVPHP